MTVAAAAALSRVIDDMQTAPVGPTSRNDVTALLYQAAAKTILESVQRTVDEKAGVAHQIVRAFSVAPLQYVAQDGTAITKLDPAPAAILHSVAVQQGREWVNEVMGKGEQ